MSEELGSRPYLAAPSATIAVLKKHGFSPRKKYGQNFLADANTAEKILRAADIGEEDFVLEIGPGIGTLTQYLSAAARSVIAVEIDRALIPILDETLSGFGNTEVICGDVLKIDVAELIKKKSGGLRIKAAANLPYYITTPVIMKLLEGKLPIESLVLMVQREVAERILAEPGSKDYGALSLAVRYRARASIAARVPAACFIPRPKVDSAVILLERYKNPPVQVGDEELMFALIRASFMQRRKTLANALSDKILPKAEALKVIEELRWNTCVRGEALSLSQFAALANRIAKISM